ncbi:MAG: zinc ribbon domain-containing protein [Myxococcota bacterium]
MRETLLSLYRLQTIDSEAQQFEDGAGNIPEQIDALEHELEVHRGELGRLNAEADNLRVESNELEGQVSEESSKHDKWKRRLNDIKSPREYQALSRELEMGERQVHAHEDRLLEIARDLEEKEKFIKEKEERLREQEAVVRGKVQQLKEQQARLRNQASERSRDRPKVAGQLPERVLKKYEQLRNARAGLAVALVKDGTCTGCQMTVRPQLQIQLMRGESLETCPNCNRLLVHERVLEEPEAGATEQT